MIRSSAILFVALSFAIIALLVDHEASAQHSGLSEFLHADLAEEALRDPPIAPPLSDPRFFGTYCLAQPRTFCKSIPILPDPCVNLSAVRAHIDHTVFRNGAIVLGDGRFTLDGKHGALALSGDVASVGKVRMAVVVPGLGRQSGEATLSADGLELSTSVSNHPLSLRKDACGNHAPTVTLSAVGGPTFTLGQSVMLSATISDAEDTDIPASRIVFASSVQGVLPGWRPAPRTLVTTVLVPGTHSITVTVT